MRAFTAFSMWLCVINGTTAGGPLTKADVAKVKLKREVANDFMRLGAEHTLKLLKKDAKPHEEAKLKYLQGKLAAPSYFGGSTKVEDLVDFLTWTKEADQLGIKLSEKDVMAILAEEFGDRLDDKERKQIGEAVRKKNAEATDEFILNALRDEFRVQIAKRALQGGSDEKDPRKSKAMPVTPEALWEHFKSKRDASELLLRPIDVSELSRRSVDPTLSRSTWEYKVAAEDAIRKLGKGDLAAGLNQLGDERWELVSIRETQFFFKRVKSPKAAGDDDESELRKFFDKHAQKVDLGLPDPPVKKAATAADQAYSAVVAWGELKVFARADSGRLVYRSYHAEGKAWSKWEQLGDHEISSAPCALITPGDRLTVFFRGADGKMYHAFQDKGREWTGFIGHWEGELRGPGRRRSCFRRGEARGAFSQEAWRH